MVLDNEALQALADVGAAKHRAMVALLKAAVVDSRRSRQRPRLLTSTVVRLEAGLSRRSPQNTGLGLFRVQDVALDGERVERALTLPSAREVTPADAAVAEVAASLAGKVTVLTSDPVDLRRLLAGTEVLVLQV